MTKSDWGFLHNDLGDGRISIPYGAKLIQTSLLLNEEENKYLHKIAEEMEISTHGVLKQALRVLQMYRAGYLVDNSPNLGGCGACE